MAEVIVLEPLEFWKGDSIETVSYRTCDYCYETAIPDVQAGKECRQFYGHEGLSICEHCLEAYLAENCT